jgi:hypothetical protein
MTEVRVLAWTVAAACLLALAWALLRRAHSRGVLGEDLHVDVAAVGLLAGLTLVFFWRIAIAGAYMPDGGGDMAGFLLPQYRFAASSLREGVFPLWNPYLYGGAPFAADVQSGVFYPLNLLLFLLVPRITFGWMEALSALHFLIAGAGMYALLRFARPRPQRIDRWAALLGGVVFMFSDGFVTHFGNTNLIAGAAWLPWALLALLRALRVDAGPRRWCWVVAGAAFVGLSGVAGHAQSLLFVVLTLSLYVFWVMAGALLRGGWDLRPVVRLATLGISALALGLGLAAVALVPAIELLPYTRRAWLSGEAAAAYSLPPTLLAGNFAPALFGRGVQQYWGPWDRVETGYVGVVAIVLALLAVLLRWRGSRSLRDLPVLFAVALGALALVLALGRATPAYQLAREAVPGFAGFRAPARFVLLVDFAVAFLAGIGMHGLLAEARSVAVSAGRKALLLTAAIGTGLLVVGGLEAQRLAQAGMRPDSATQLAVAVAPPVAALLAAGVVIALYGRGVLSARQLRAVLVVMTFAELFAAGASMAWAEGDPTQNLDPPAMAFLESDAGLYRIEVRPEVWYAWSPDAALVHGEYDVGGIYNPLGLAAYQLVWESLTDRESRLYDFLNAKYVVGPKDLALPWDRFVPVFDADPDLNIYLNLESLPRAVAVLDAHIVSSQNQAWSVIQSPDFDPSREVVVEGATPEVGRATPDGGNATPGVVGSAAADGTGGTGAAPAEQEGGILGAAPVAEIIAYGPHAIDVAVNMPADGYLVLSENYYPGWRATVDGALTHVDRANYAFRAVAVPAGEHVVRLRFRPASQAVGLGVSLLALGVCALLGWRCWRQRLLEQGVAQGQTVS